MKIDLERLRLHPREIQEFHFDEPGRNEYLEDLGGKFLDNLKVDVVVSKPGKFYLARGQVKTVLELQCSRCLEKFFCPINTDFYLNLVQSQYQDEFTRDEDAVFFDHDEVEIQPFIEGLVFSEIPFIPLCNENCQGLCSECGTNLNVAQCKCEHDNTDPRWEKLKDFKIGKEVT